MQSYTISHGHPPHDPSPSLLSTPTTQLPADPFVISPGYLHGNTESGFSIDFPETTHALSFLPPSFFPSYPLNRRFLQCLCITTLSSFLLCCFHSLLHITTYDNDPTLRTFFIDHSPHSTISPSVLPHTSLCRLLVSTPENPRSPCDMDIWFPMCLCFRALFFPISSHYVFIPPHSPCFASFVRSPKLSCLSQSRLYHYCLFRT